MALHELATNATKHGALSVPDGRVTVSWHVADEISGSMLSLRWTEVGGPMIAGVPGRRGFGSRVIEATIRGQLGGTVRKIWDPGGLVCELAVPLRSTHDQCPSS